MCKEAGGGGEGARDTESKTRTPHKVVGKKQAAAHEPECSHVEHFCEIIGPDNPTCYQLL